MFPQNFLVPFHSHLLQWQHWRTRHFAFSIGELDILLSDLCWPSKCMWWICSSEITFFTWLFVDTSLPRILSHDFINIISLASPSSLSKLNWTWKEPKISLKTSESGGNYLFEDHQEEKLHQISHFHRCSTSLLFNHNIATLFVDCHTLQRDT